MTTNQSLVDSINGVFTDGQISTSQINALLTQFASRSTATAALSVGIVTGISAAASTGMLTWYSLNRRRANLQTVYFPRQAKLLTESEIILSSRTGGLYGRLSSLARLSFFLPSNRRLQALVDFIGIDSTAYLLHYRLCAVLLFAIALGGLTVSFIDYQYNGSTRLAADILDATSMLRLKGQICWVHAIFAIYSTLCSILLIQTYYLKFYLVRSYWFEKAGREHKRAVADAKEAGQKPPKASDRTWAMVSGGISNFQDVAIFPDEPEETYEIMSGLKVRKTQRATSRLNKDIKTFESTAIKYLQAQESIEDASEARDRRSDIDRQRRELRLSKKDVKSALKKTADVMGRSAGAQIKLAQYEKTMKRLVKRIAEQTTKLDQANRWVKRDGRWAYEFKGQGRDACCGRRRGEPNMDKWLSKSYGFVLLESNLAARYCVYRLRSTQRFSILSAILHHFCPRPNAELAPGAGGLDWMNIVKNRVLRVSATFKGTTALAITLFLFTVFQILIATLANADSWTSVFPILESWQNKEIAGLPVGKWLFAGLVGGVPPALTAATRSLLPMAVRRLAKVRGARTWSKLVEVCIAWLYIAQVFCQVTAFTLAGTIWVFASAVVKQAKVTGLDPLPILRTLKAFPYEAIQSCLHSSNYWLSSFASSVAMAFFDLLLPFRLFHHYRRTQLQIRKRQLTVRERAANAAPGRDADLDARSASLLLELAVVFTYCSLAPLISILGFIAVLVQYRVAHVQLTKVFQPPPETGGGLWRVLTNRLLFSVGVIQPVILAEAMGLQFGWQGVLVSLSPTLLIAIFRLQLVFNLFGHWRRGGRVPWSLDDAVEWGGDLLALRDLISLDSDHLHDRRLRRGLRDLLYPVEFDGKTLHDRQRSALYDPSIKPRMPRFDALPRNAATFREMQLIRLYERSDQIFKSPWSQVHGTHPMFDDAEYIDLVELLGAEAMERIGAVCYAETDTIEVELGYSV